ncbi:hypothetical protein ABZ805_16090 [Saccharopolyspora sp. NPDC047091]|uniref:hypothetical protein n=1 Tax=Saccharopolyspora sp. NPDC047091 TaxID=3155924 RepID=UPI0033D98A65
MQTPDLDHVHEATIAAATRETEFWQRMTELGIPDGQAWDALRVVLAETEHGTPHADPWTAATALLTNTPQRSPHP